ncbi:PIN domain-containing protein [Streptomyces sp. NPDC056269]|uniref:PIN domain-containing protein n=1 Tax=Streptomyces sp. NPDC056269 TaxID=3345768 RepID=UPI0035DA96AA
MIVTPIPGTSRDNVYKVLRGLWVSASNLDSQHSNTAYERLLRYLEWVNESQRMLVGQISGPDIDRLVRTRMYESLLDGVGHLASTDHTRLLNGLIANEVRERVAALEEASSSFAAQMDRWPAERAVVVPDTSFFIRHERKFKEVDFLDRLAPEADLVSVVVPMVVVDELDRLKESRDKYVRWRAGHTLGFLDELLDGDALLGEAKVELLTDNRGHVRLPEADDEIVDRATAVQSMAAGPVRLITYDTGMAMRAKLLGLSVLKLRTDAGTGEEPESR